MRNDSAPPPQGILALVELESKISALNRLSVQIRDFADPGCVDTSRTLFHFCSHVERKRPAPPAMTQTHEAHSGPRRGAPAARDLEDGWQRTVQWMARVPVGSPAYVALDALCGMQIVAIKAARSVAEVGE